MNRTDTAQILAVLSAAFPHISVTRETAEVYHEALADLDPVDCRDAVREILLTVERWPAPATIRRRVAERAGILAPLPLDAWGQVISAAGSIGVYGDPQFTHSAIDRCVRSIGWRNVCLSENPDALRAQFLRAYDSERLRADTEALTGQIAALTAPPAPALESAS